MTIQQFIQKHRELIVSIMVTDKPWVDPTEADIERYIITDDSLYDMAIAEGVAVFRIM